MKFSLYNSILLFSQEKYALYNSFEQKVLFLDEDLKNILEENRTNNIDNLKIIHPTFYNALEASGFVIDESINEVEEIKKLSEEIDNNPTIFLLTINPTMNCNFKCWYCYETHIRKSRLDHNTLESIKKFINKTAQNPELKFFNLSFFGGEPLMYFKKDVVPVIDYFIDVCKKRGFDYKSWISFTTNGYLISNEIIDYFKDSEITPNFQITFDGYKKEHNEVRFAGNSKGSYDIIVKNIKELLENGFYIRARINYTDKNVRNCFKIIDDFTDMPQKIKEENLIFDFHRVWQNDSVDDTADIMKENAKKMREMGFQTNVKYSPNNVAVSCYADKRNSVVINYNGDIYKCTARDFSSENRTGYLSKDGDLIWNNGYLEKRMAAKFHNPPCLECAIMPICNGGCSQHALEHGEKEESYCVYHSDKSEIERVIRTKIEEIIDVQK